MYFRFFLTGLLCAACAVAQTAPDRAPAVRMLGGPALSTSLAPDAEKKLFSDQSPKFPQRSYFKRMFDTTPTGFDLNPPVHLADYVVDGKLELSMRSYLDAVLANNTDITIQKLSVEVSRNAILRAFSVFD